MANAGNNFNVQFTYHYLLDQYGGGGIILFSFECISMAEFKYDGEDLNLNLFENFDLSVSTWRP